MSSEELRAESATMVWLRKSCTNLANEDLSLYTSTMASILNVRQNLLGCESPVLNRDDWIKSIVDNPSDLSIQKWIFAWMYVRSNYKKLVSQVKSPDENFEDQFMEKHGLQYDSDSLKNMKKNAKTCIHLLYNLRARSWKEKMITQFKTKLNLNIALTAPMQIRSGDKNYRREPNTFFVGKITDGKMIWNKVSVYYSIC